MRFCNKCGDIVEPGERFCNKCGNVLIDNNLYAQQTVNINNKKNSKNKIIIGIALGISVIIIVASIITIINSNKNKYYFDPSSYNPTENEPVAEEQVAKDKYSTIIVYDNKYSGIEINNKNDVYELIEKDSVSQKKSCPTEMKKIEDDIISKYGITAVNLCELDLEYAKELENVFKTVYNEYPEARGIITNLTLVNAPISEGYIAAFMPLLDFAKANTNTGYPLAFKTLILLNTSYFFNIERLEVSTKEGSLAGHFPPNATKYSPVAHELGHYLSFIAMMKNYNSDSILIVDNNNITTLKKLATDFDKGDFSLSMIKEAYNNCKNDKKTTLELDEWRGTISLYALAKDNNGDYIYDETIAEAFHDVYLNKDKAKDASKYIIKVLKEKLRG